MAATTNVNLKELIGDFTLQKIARGESVLFLGAGAVFGATSHNGTTPLSGNQLRDKFSDHFLGGKKKTEQLIRVSDLSIDRSSLIDVQQYVFDLFNPLMPGRYHKLIPLFRWRAIFTTNYDLVIERAYDVIAERMQTLRPLIRDGINLDSIYRDPNALPYFKLHGCITRIDDKSLPLILTSDQYAKYIKNRKRLFTNLVEKANDCPIIFCGYKLSDPNIVPYFIEIDDESISRERYVLIDPNLDELDINYWKTRRVDALKMTCEQFFDALANEIPTTSRVLSGVSRQDNSSLSRWNSTHRNPSADLLGYLQNELDHVYEGMHLENVSIKDFFRGFTESWTPIKNDFDIPRPVPNAITAEVLLHLDEIPKTYLLKGYAGGGITVALRRIAWDLSKHGKLVFYLKEDGLLRDDLIAEIAEITREKLVIVVDNAQFHSAELSAAIKKLRELDIPVTFVLGTRANEWNIYGAELATHVDVSFEISDLSYSEAQALVGKLDENECLGYLKSYSPDERIAEILKLHDRQLLVALHEVMSNHKSFNEIVEDEYNQILPERARLLYLDICTLNRFGVPVRAGVISRMSGIRFIEFGRDFFAPLEHVVRTAYDRLIRDNVYRTRHPQIAQAVFAGVLKDPVKRAQQICRIVAHMNIDYASDDAAFGKLIQGRNLADEFLDKALVEKIYEAALQSGAKSTYVNHQHANFELHHVGCDIKYAYKLIQDAERGSEAPTAAVLHTKAEILRRMAISETNQALKDRERNEAAQILRKIISRGFDSRPYISLANLKIDMLSEYLEQAFDGDDTSTDTSERLIADWISEVELTINDGLRKYPDDEFLLGVQHRMAVLIQDMPKAVRVLERIVKKNPASVHAVFRLARYCFDKGEIKRAIQLVVACAKALPSDKTANLNAAIVLSSIDEMGHSEQIKQYFRRAFTEGDTNHHAMFRLARHLYLTNDRVGANALFEKLKLVRTSPSFKEKPQLPILDNHNVPIRFTATLRKHTAGYCFLRIPQLHGEAFSTGRWFNDAYPEELTDATWQCMVGFNYRGPIAFDVKLDRSL